MRLTTESVAWRDVCRAACRLRAAPLFVVFAVSSLAVGIGAPASVYAVVKMVLWSSPAVADAGDLVTVAVPGPGGRYTWRGAVSRTDYLLFEKAGTWLRDISGFSEHRVVLDDGLHSHIVNAEAVTGSYFEQLGVQTAIGRAIAVADVEAAADVVVLSHRFWNAHFAGASDVLHRQVRIAGRPFQIVGVLAPPFDGLGSQGGMRTEIWIPVDAAANGPSAATRAENASRPRLAVVGRLRPGSSAERASHQAAALATHLDRVDGAPTASRQWSVRTLEEVNADPVASRFGLVLVALAALLFVISCSNLATLLLARGESRKQELITRRALGASRSRLMRELSVENVIVAVAGGVLSIAVTWALCRMFRSAIPTATGTFLIEPTLTAPVMVFILIAALSAAIIIAVVPAWYLTAGTTDRARLVNDASTKRWRRYRLLLRWQVAISTCFLVISAAALHFVAIATGHDPGIDLSRLTMASVDFRLIGWTEERARIASARAVDSLIRHPAIEAAAVSSGAPFGTNMTPFGTVTVTGSPLPVKPPTVSILAVTPSVFATWGVPLLRGQLPESFGSPTPARQVVLSQRTALMLFRSTDVIGQRIQMQVRARPPAETYEVVGVAADTDTDTFLSRLGHLIYVPLGAFYQPRLTIFARTTGDVDDGARILRDSLHQVDPDFSPITVGSAIDLLAGRIAVARRMGLIAAVLAALTLFLAVVGLYAVMSQAVAGRTRELGLRVALGASQRGILLMSLKDGLTPVAQGIGMGAVLAFVAVVALRAIQAAPSGIGSPFVLVLLPLPLLVAALGACWLPGWRASRTDPAIALRHS